MNENIILIGLALFAVWFIFIKKEKSRTTETNPQRPKEDKSSSKDKKIGSKKRLVLQTPHDRVMSVTMHNGGWACATYSTSGVVHVYLEGSGIPTVIKAGESGYQLSSIDGTLVLSCEKSKTVWNGETGERLSGGHNYMVTSTRKIFDKFVSLSSTKFTGNIAVKIHAPNEPLVFLTKGGNWFSRDMFEMNGVAYVLAFNYSNETGYYFTSTDLKKWSRVELGKNIRPMLADAYKKGVVITFSRYKNKERKAAGVLSLKPDGTVAMMDEDAKHGGAFGVDVKNDKDIFYTTLNWKGGGKATVRTNQNGYWETLVEFDESEALGTALNDNNNLYVGTSSGRLYEIGDVDETALPPMPSIETIGGGFVWKPVSEGDHKLVVLLPKSAKLYGHIYFNGEKSKKGKRTNGDRPTYRFSKKGADYPANSALKIGNTSYSVPNPSKRYG